MGKWGNTGLTPLHKAVEYENCQEDRIPVVEALISNGNKAFDEEAAQLSVYRHHLQSVEQAKRPKQVLEPASDEGMRGAKPGRKKKQRKKQENNKKDITPEPTPQDQEKGEKLQPTGSTPDLTPSGAEVMAEGYRVANDKSLCNNHDNNRYQQ